MRIKTETSLAREKPETPSAFPRPDAFTAIHKEQEEIYQKAYNAAVASRSLKPDPAMLEAIEEASRGQLRSHNTEPYDPGRNPDDRAREERFENRNLAANQQEQAVQHSNVKVRECRENASRLHPGEEPVITPSLRVVVVSATLALAGTLIPTIIDALS